MAGFLRKGALKLKIILRPTGFSRIRRGLATGICWTHEVSDLRYLLGDYEPELANWLKSKMAQDYSFIDVGANAGYFSLLAAKFATDPSQRIIAIEPVAENLKQIKRHIEWNHYPRIEVLPFVIADRDRMVEFSNSSNLAANTYAESSSLHKNYPKVSLAAKSLDSICEDIKLKKFVLKIDVEGAELDVLKGARNVLVTHQPEIILATHECHVKNVEQDCLDFLKSVGYVCEPMADVKFVEGQMDYICKYQEAI